jgi:hypothetical protein
MISRRAFVANMTAAAAAIAAKGATFMTGLYPSEHGVFNNVDTDTARPRASPGQG